MSIMCRSAKIKNARLRSFLKSRAFHKVWAFTYIIIDTFAFFVICGRWFCVEWHLSSNFGLFFDYNF